MDCKASKRNFRPVDPVGNDLSGQEPMVKGSRKGGAGWILLTTYGFLFWGRTAADMENLAAITLAVAWYWKRRERPNFCSYIVFYLIFSLGAQTKGLTAMVVPVVAVLPDSLRECRWKMHLSFSHLMALALGAAIYLCPLIWERKGHRKPVAWMIFN